MSPVHWSQALDTGPLVPVHWSRALGPVHWTQRPGPCACAAIPIPPQGPKGPMWRLFPFQFRPKTTLDTLKMLQNAPNRDFWRPCEERRSPYGGIGKKRALRAMALGP